MQFASSTEPYSIIIYYLRGVGRGQAYNNCPGLCAGESLIRTRTLTVRPPLPLLIAGKTEVLHLQTIALFKGCYLSY